ncbi:pseudouridine synthase, partial [Candidatus Parcubacteria bacterium]
MNEQEVVVLEYPGNGAQRLDKFLTRCFPEQSRARVQAWIKAGRVLVNGCPAKKSGLLLEGGEEIVVHVPPPEKSALEPEPLPLDVLF